MSRNDDFLRELRATFKVEAQDHVQTLSRGLEQLERIPVSESPGVWQTIFRAVHSLKGAARAVDVLDIESLCQALEDVFASRRGQASAASPELMKMLLRASDSLDTLVSALDQESGTPKSIDLQGIRLGLRQLMRDRPSSPEGPASSPSARVSAAKPPSWADPTSQTLPTRVGAAVAVAVPAGAADPTFISPESAAPVSASTITQTTASGADDHAQLVDETVRVQVPRLEAQLGESEELLLSKFASARRVERLEDLSTWFAEWHKARQMVDTDLRRLKQSAKPEVLSLLDYFQWSDGAARALETTVTQISDTARSDYKTVVKTVDSVVEGARRLLLLPFSTISASFPKLVRDVCRAQGKDAEFIVTGEQVEMDKLILEKMKDPLVHMLRNAVDHGVETPQERLAAGKPVRATIRLDISQVAGNRVRIVLADDGAGIQSDLLKSAGVELGIISADDAAGLDEKSAHDLAFRANVSSRSTVTNLSGRGLGLAIVRENVDSLGGDLNVQSARGTGTTFTMEFAAVRATYRGVMCMVGSRRILVPTANVERVIRIEPSAVRLVNGSHTIVHGARTLPLLSLGAVLDIPALNPALQVDYLQVIVICEAAHSVAFVVDQIVQEQEVLVKPLRKPLARVRNIAAAAVLGSGEVVPILHVADVLKSSRLASGVRLRGVLPEAGAASLGHASSASGRAPKKVLLAEDSITSRMLLKAVLESAGYQVSTAVDGLDAFSQLRGGRFDLLVSDIEMPRLSGIDLTARVRAEESLSDLPVVLVSALASREDKERGVDVGANAYIVKGGFDQDDLLRAVERLI